VKAVILKRFGGPDGLERVLLADPAPAAGEVLLRVRACALNRLDLWIRQGLPSAKISLPFILGSDAAGDIAALGAGVENFKIGDRCAVHPGRCCGQCVACTEGREPDCPNYGIIGAYGGHPGAYAELLCVPAHCLLPMPQTLSFIEAASAPLTFLTAWHMLITLAKLQPHETLLIIGAGAGVSTAALAIAKWSGARVIATSTSADKLARARALGADETIHHPPEDLARSVRRLTHGRMVDAVIEHVGPAVLGDALKCLRRSGRLVTCGATSGPVAEIDLRYVFDRQLNIMGARMGSLAEMRRVWSLLSAGALKPVIDRTFTLEQAAAAHDYLSSRTQFGKVVLTL
jgi:NADPH:quinone reductase-like Zn-dependent oxidoreductase